MNQKSIKVVTYGVTEGNRVWVTLEVCECFTELRNQHESIKEKEPEVLEKGYCSVEAVLKSGGPVPLRV